MWNRMQMELYQLIYVSRATDLFKLHELERLLAQSRANNQSKDITGLLLYKDLSFLQILEGEKVSVLDLYNIITANERHYRLRLLSYEPIEQRLFGDWSMGFQLLGEQNKPEIEGYSEFFSPEFKLTQLYENNSHKVEQFLRVFRAES